MDLDAIHLPDDAGEYADGLLRILNRIPPRWGRWISCDKGWYPLVIELDERLAQVVPDYELHQVKEKFGTLRYYIGLPQPEPQCCIDVDALRPHPGAVDPKYFHGERTVQQQYELDKWYYTVLIPHLDSESHEAQSEALQPERERRNALLSTAHEIIREYEERSAVTCEVCSAPATLMARHFWYRTLCIPCAEAYDYYMIDDSDDNDDSEE